MQHAGIQAGPTHCTVLSPAWKVINLTEKNLLSTRPASHQDQKVPFRSLTPNVVFHLEPFFVLGHSTCRIFCCNRFCWLLLTNKLLKDHTYPFRENMRVPPPSYIGILTYKEGLIVMVMNISLLLRKENLWPSVLTINHNMISTSLRELCL